MAVGIRAKFEAIREDAFGDVGAAYSTLGAVLADYTRLIRLVNDTDADVYISFDGTTNHIRLKTNTFFLIDVTSNKQSNSQLYIAKGTQIYQKRVAGAPTTGTVWAEVMYGEGGK